jgi:hypothetical protein
MTDFGAFAKLRNATSSLILSLRLPAWNYWMDFYETWYLNVFQKSVKKNSSLIKV